MRFVTSHMHALQCVYVSGSCASCCRDKEAADRPTFADILLRLRTLLRDMRMAAHDAAQRPGPNSLCEKQAADTAEGQ